jgi:hypothetical protein
MALLNATRGEFISGHMLQLEYLPVNKNVFLRIQSQIRLRSLPTLIPRFNK